MRTSRWALRGPDRDKSLHGLPSSDPAVFIRTLPVEKCTTTPVVPVEENELPKGFSLILS